MQWPQPTKLSHACRLTLSAVHMHGHRIGALPQASDCSGVALVRNCYEPICYVRYWSHCLPRPKTMDPMTQKPCLDLLSSSKSRALARDWNWCPRVVARIHARVLRHHLWKQTARLPFSYRDGMHRRARLADPLP